MCSLFNALKYLKLWLSKYVKSCPGHGDSRSYIWWQKKSESVNHFQLTCSSVSVIESQFFFLNKVLNILIHIRAQLLCLKQDREKSPSMSSFCVLLLPPFSQDSFLYFLPETDIMREDVQ